MPRYNVRRVPKTNQTEYNTDLEISAEPEPDKEPEPDTSEFLEIH